MPSPKKKIFSNRMNLLSTILPSDLIKIYHKNRFKVCSSKPNVSQEKIGVSSLVKPSEIKLYNI